MNAASWGWESMAGVGRCMAQYLLHEGGSPSSPRPGRHPSFPRSRRGFHTAGKGDHGPSARPDSPPRKTVRDVAWPGRIACYKEEEIGIVLSVGTR